MKQSQNKNGERFLGQITHLDVPPPNTIIEGQIRECYGRVVYTHKTHEKCADLLLFRNSRIKTSQIILSAITTGGLVATIINIEGNSGTIITTVLSTILLGLNIYIKNYNLEEIAEKHRQAAREIWLIREKYLSLLTDLRIGQTEIEAIQNRRDKLLDELFRVYSGAPGTNYRAYCEAREALKNLEEMTFSSEEIDQLLPQDLRRN